jgi:hypothetical protein
LVGQRHAGISTGTGLLRGDLDNIRLEMDARHPLSGPGLRPADRGQRRRRDPEHPVRPVLVQLPGRWRLLRRQVRAIVAHQRLRIRLADQRIRVAGLHVAYMDTDMTQAVTAPKSAPADVARLAADGIATGAYETSQRTPAARSSPGWPQASPGSTRSYPEGPPPREAAPSPSMPVLDMSRPAPTFHISRPWRSEHSA